MILIFLTLAVVTCATKGTMALNVLSIIWSGMSLRLL